MKILFFGDSITDAYRNRGAACLSEALGAGFVMLIANELLRRDPEKYEIINRGVGGDRSAELINRLEADVLSEKPDVLNILVGINDIWHGIDSPKKGISIDQYGNHLRYIIESVLNRNPSCKIILCEPFVLSGKHTDPHMKEFSRISQYAEAARAIAEEYHIHFLPLQEKLNHCAKRFSAQKTLGDGVHPAMMGAITIADAWINIFDTKLLF